MVSARNFVKGKAGTVVIIAGIVLGGAYLAKRFNVGSKVITAVQGAGNATGQGIVAPFTGILQGIDLGGQALASQLGDIQKNLFNQIKTSTDQFNNLFHPDWYNQDGTYSPANPNYGKGQSTIAQPSNTSIIIPKQGSLVQNTPSDQTGSFIGSNSNKTTTLSSGTKLLTGNPLIDATRQYYV